MGGLEVTQSLRRRLNDQLIAEWLDYLSFHQAAVLFQSFGKEGVACEIYATGKPLEQAALGKFTLCTRYHLRAIPFRQEGMIPAHQLLIVE